MSAAALILTPKPALVLPSNLLTFAAFGTCVLAVNELEADIAVKVLRKGGAWSH